MKLRRGFKTEAEAITSEVRQELGLSLHDRLDPLRLAEHLGIDVVGLGDLAGDGASSAATRHFTVVDKDEFSAATVFRGSRRLVVINPSHAPTRTASNVAHELSHSLLWHEPQPALNGGCRVWTDEVEGEAEWLGACLLVPRDAALRAARNGMEIEQAALRFGVSVQLMSWRLNHSGAVAQAERERVARQRRFPRPISR